MLPMTMPVLPPYLKSVQALRGIAALLVVCFHCAGTQCSIIPGQDVDILSGFWDKGYAGVDMFFVISGFIMVFALTTISLSVFAAMLSYRFVERPLIRLLRRFWLKQSCAKIGMSGSAS